MAKKINQADCPVIGTDRLTEVFIPRIPNEKDQADMFVSVNGKNYLIQRGKRVRVPANVKEVIDASVRKAQAADEFYYAAAAKGGF